MLNAFLHAQATLIEVQIIYGIDDLRLHVRDDGDGIATNADEAARPGHFGIKGMRERTQKIGAELDIWSRHGAGTEVLLRIPAAIAYTERQRLFRWLPLWLGRGEIK
jgi:signal transduction histidine kinase